METSGARDAFDDLQSKGENVFRPDEHPSGVAAVGPDQPDGGEAAAPCGQESVCGVAVGDRGGGDDDGERRPFTSTARCRCAVGSRGASQPRLDRGTVSAAGTVCESMIATVGHRSRPARTRRRSRSASRMRCHAPPRAQRANTAYTVAAGGNCTGSCRHAIPPPRGVQDGVHYHTAAMLLGSSTAACRAAPAQATAVRGSPAVRRSPTTRTPRNHVRAPRGAGTTGMARSAMMALRGSWSGRGLVITDPTKEPSFFGSPRGTRPPILASSQTLS